MPLYSYKCIDCDKEVDKYLHIVDYKEIQYCDTCRQAMLKVLKPASISVDYPDYQCPVTGKTISGKKAHLENLKKTNCRILEKGEMEDSNRRKQKEDEELYSSISKTVAKEISNMSEDKLARLGKELESGADVQFNRS